MRAEIRQETAGASSRCPDCRIVRAAVAQATAVAVIGLVLGGVAAGAALAGSGGSVRSPIG